MRSFHRTNIICLFISSLLQSGELPNPTLMHELFRDRPVVYPSERDRKIAWVEEVHDQRKYVFEARATALLCSKLAQDTPLPAAMHSLIAEYLLQWNYHVVNIHDGSVSRIIYTTRQTACSYATHYRNSPPIHSPAYTWNINNGAIITDNGDRAPFIKINSLELEDERLDEQCFDYDISPDKWHLAVSLRTGLYICPHSWELPFMELKKLRMGVYIPTNSPMNYITVVAFSPCSNYLFAGSLNGTVSVFNRQSNRRIGVFIHNAAVTALACTFDDELLVGLENGSIYVWRGELCNAYEDVPVGPSRQTFTDEAAPDMLVPIPPNSSRSSCWVKMEDSCCRCICLCRQSLLCQPPG